MTEVAWYAKSQRWEAYAHLDGRKHYLGRFDTVEGAAETAATWRARNMPFSPEAVAA